MKLIIMTFFLVLNLSSWAQAETKEYGVSGMVCSFCSQGIEKKFKEQAAVADVKVSLKDKKLVITFKENQVLTDQEVEKILESAGYKMTAKAQ
ncbi:MAG: heavy-metal-associated domain-containing protein [Bdellovibrionia bacterium]